MDNKIFETNLKQNIFLINNKIKNICKCYFYKEKFLKNIKKVLKQNLKK